MQENTKHLEGDRELTYKNIKNMKLQQRKRYGSTAGRDK